MNKTDDQPDLSAAYALEGPEGSRKLYRDWAETYDATFAEAQEYAYPSRIAALFDEQAQGTDRPVLDVGCGTGLVAGELAAAPVDGLDISPEMLQVARGKMIYRNLIEGDLTSRLPIEDDVYGGFISAGTFTHGHVGPEALDELIRIGQRGALYVLGVNAQVYRDMNFAEKVLSLGAAGLIGEAEQVEGRIYATGADHDHKNDLFRALVFRKQ